MQHSSARRSGTLGIAIVVLVLMLTAPATAHTPVAAEAGPVAASPTANTAAQPILLAAEDPGDEKEWPVYAYVIVAVGGTLLVVFGFALNARDRRRDTETPNGGEGSHHQRPA